MSITSSSARFSINKSTLPALLLGLAICVYAVGFSYLTLNRYAAFEARALDLGNLHQTVWNTAHGRPFAMTNQPDTVNRLSLHVEPILLPIAALYWIHDGPETLLILQSIVVALGAWPLYALALYRLDNRWLALALSLVYLLNPTIQAANWLEFHPVTLAPTLLMAAFYFLVTRRNGWFIFFALLAASCKEEIGLLLFMMGLYAALMLRRPRLGGWIMLLALSWSLVAVLGIQNHFAAGNIHWGRYDYLGATPLAKVMALFTQPGLVWQQLQSADAGGYLFRLLWPVGFVALLAPEILLLALPSLAINLLADFPPMHEVYTLIYAAPILPFVMLATVEGIGRVAGCCTSAAFVGARYLMPRRMHQSNQMRHILRPVTLQLLVFVALVGAFIAQWQHGYLPGGGNYEHYTVSDHDRRAAAIMAQIPADAKVSAQDKLDPHVAGRETVYIFPRIDDADTIFVDVTGPAWPIHPSDLHATIEQLLFTDWGVAAGDDGYLLLRKGLPNRTIPRSFYSAFQPPVSAQPPDQPVSIFGEALALLDHQVHVDEHGETVVQLRWKALRHPLTTDYRIYVAFANKEGTIAHDSLFYPPVATLWYPTSMWHADEQVLVQTLPWQPELDQFTLLVGVYTGEEGWHNGGRISLSNGSTPDRIHLEQNTVVRLGGYRWVRGEWQPIPRRTTLENLAQHQVVHFTDGKAQIQLENVLMESVPEHAGDVLTFALEWWAGREPIPLDYSVFAHLLNEQGEKVAQLDWQPRDDWGPRPMTTWFEATSIVDEQRLPLPEDLPAGNYHLVIGVYNWQTGERLAISGAGATPDNVAPIAEISIK